MRSTNPLPGSVKEILSRHILADGYDLVYDINRSDGVYMYDSLHDRNLLDFFTCFASVPLGYNHPKMKAEGDFRENLLEAALANPSNSDIYTVQYAAFVKCFSETGIPSYLPHAFFIAGGSLAIENALKAAMDWKVQKNFAKGLRAERGHKVLHFEQAFHGRSGYTLSLTNTQPSKTKWFAQFDWPRVPFPKVIYPLNEQSLQDVIAKEQEVITLIKQTFAENPDEICAIITEPVQAEGGDNHARPEFFKALRQICDEEECLLIYDEVQTGVGLSGRFWLHEHFGKDARPDILAFGKKMQICGILASRRLDEVKENVFRVSSRINSTWGGNLVDMVRSQRILEIIHEDSLLDKASYTGAYLLQCLVALCEEFSLLIFNARGRGLLCAFDFHEPVLRDSFIKRGLEKQVLFLGCYTHTIRFRPALIMDAQTIDQGIFIARSILKEFASKTLTRS